MVGTFLPSDGVDAMKRKIALAYGMNLPLPVQTKLLHKNAEVDCSVFTSLSSFLERLPSSTARSNIFSLGLPPDYELEEMEVRKAVDDMHVLNQMVTCVHSHHTCTPAYTG